MEHVAAVKSAFIVLLKSNPPKIVVLAVGEVISSGWSNAQLGSRFHVTEPDDGIQEFDFYAKPPTDASLPVVLPVTAETCAKGDPENYWGPGKPLRGVRIHSRTNAIEVTIDTAVGLEPFGDGLPVPWPFPWRTTSPRGGSDSPFPLGGDLPFPFGIGWGTAVGKTLRVYHTGDLISQNHDVGRFNVELNPANERIVSTWIG